MASVFDLALNAALLQAPLADHEIGLDKSFAQVCHYMADFPESRLDDFQSLDLNDIENLKLLSGQYFAAYRKSDFPKSPQTKTDEIVKLITKYAFYPDSEMDELMQVHRNAMMAENCVGNLLERYIDSVMRKFDWHWCCGDLVKSTDFLHSKADGTWIALQIKTGSSSENSSSSKIRQGTEILKWHRRIPKSGNTRWHKLPEVMLNKGLSEQGFETYVRKYLSDSKNQNSEG